jgi:biopolymer transport protein ExbD
VNAEINLTNLIDVAFVLLIIFMITAPILQGGVDVDLPVADAVPIESSDATIVTVTRDGTIYIDKAVVSLGEFGEQVKRIAGDGAVTVRGDRTVQLGVFMPVLAELQKVGITKVNFPLVPDDAR